tara:strand:- start:1790 stop:2173 length:384 start_codon:yes stop_codon:yes gene_type:complete
MNLLHIISKKIIKKYMWIPDNNKNILQYYNKLIYVTYKYSNFKPILTYGLLDFFSSNSNDYYTVILYNPINGVKESIVSTLIESVFYDYSIQNIGKFYYTKKYLSNFLNDDTINEIKLFLINDIVFL